MLKTRMVVLTINIEPDLYQALRTEAIERDVSMAKIVRQELRAVLLDESIH